MKSNFDRKLLITTILLISVGVVMIFSATSIRCAKDPAIGNAWFYFQKVMFRVVLGAIAMIITLNIDYRNYKKYYLVFLAFSAILLFLTAIPSIAGDAGGATRWIKIYSLTLQPSEIAKVAIVIFLAEYLARKAETLDNFAKGFLPATIIVGGLVAAIALQPNYGMAVAIALVSAIMFFVVGVPMKNMLYVGVPAVSALAFGVMHSGHARARVITFISGGDPLGAGFQIQQSLIALGTGSFAGLGIGNGVQKLMYVPELHTDFIFAVIGEELGFLGTVAVMAMFLFISWRGLKIALRAPDRFGCNLAIGLTSMIFIYAALNVGVVLNLLPTTGIPLPFISYGGSALVVAMASVGILLNISTHATKSLETEILLTNEQRLGSMNADIGRRRWHRRTPHPGFEYSSGVEGLPPGH
ncbi:MAG TPA: putative lipid II flippase FtsW [candidate division Zixibacteria bacterium]|nr:putative lipid II flippase FtsW [candidate division Zixibacteria bacterium]